MLARYYGDLPNVVVEPGVKTGVQLAIDNPKEVGADRVVNTLAAHALYGGPSIVVDFGTTTNFDVISARGEFLGGAFALGFQPIDPQVERSPRGKRCALVRALLAEHLGEMRIKPFRIVAAHMRRSAFEIG